MFARTFERRIATIPFASGETVSTELTGAKGRVRGLILEITGDLVITTAGTNYIASRNPGTIVPTIAVRLNQQQTLKTGRWNDWIDRAYAWGKIPAQTVIGTKTAGTYPFKSRIELPFSMPLSANPADSFLPLGQLDRLDLDLGFGTADSLVPGSTTQAVSGCSVAVTMVGEVIEYDAAGQMKSPPLFIYKESAFERNPGASANADYQDLQMTVGTGLRYHHLILNQEDKVANTGRVQEGTVTDFQIQQTAGGRVSQPIGVLSGSQLQHAYNMQGAGSPLIDAVSAAPGLYPVCWPGSNDGMASYGLDMTGVEDLRYIIGYGAPTTDAYFRVLAGMYQEIALQS